MGYKEKPELANSTVAGLLDSPGGAAVHEHAARPPARECEHGRWLASRCALREHRCSPKLLVAVATFGSPDDSMLIRRSAAMSGPGVPDGRCS